MIGRPVPPVPKALQRLRERADELAAQKIAPAPSAGQLLDAAADPARTTSSNLVSALGIAQEHGPLTALEIPRRTPGPQDVLIDIEFCGLCHSDVHAGRGEWGAKALPLVPGHEIVGIVGAVGEEVTDLAVGARVGVGCLVDSCRTCDACTQGLEQFCSKSVGTYGARNIHTGEDTQGGYSKAVVVDRDFVLRIPDALDPAAAAPLLCAGITTYSPLRHHNIGPGSTVGVLGLGGLGHMAVKLAVAMGATVTVFTRGEAKRASATELGAQQVINTADADALAHAANTLNLIIDTVSAPHSIDPYLRTLKRDGALVQLSLPAGNMPEFDVHQLIFKRLSYTGSLIGSIGETQEMLDFCAEHGITSDIEMVDAPSINAAWDRMVASDVKYRFVLDLATLDSPAPAGDTMGNTAKESA